MYLPKKFNYSLLSKTTTNGKRMYVDPYGNKLPSVTTVLDATKSKESKQALHEWRKRVGEKQATLITTEAAGRGTRMHSYLEGYIKTGELKVPGTNPYSKQSHRMASTIIEDGLVNCNEFWGTEISLFCPNLYAGTTDLVGVHKNTDAIMDFKQSNKPKKREWIEDYFLQLVAYAECHNQVYNTSINKGVIFMCTPDCIYQEFIIEGSEFDRYTYEWLKRLELYYMQS